MEISYDAAIRLIESDVGEGAKLVPMLRSCLPLCGNCCVHRNTAWRSLVGQALLLEMLSDVRRGNLVTRMVRESQTPSLHVILNAKR